VKSGIADDTDCVPDAATFTFEDAVLSCNNLGDQGPLEGPHYMRYEKAGILANGEPFDMTVEALNADYVALRPDLNGKRGKSGQINCQMEHEAHLKFTLVKHNTYDPIVIPAFYISIFDIDKNMKTSETVSVGGYEELIIPENPEFNVTYTPFGATMTSFVNGFYCDNPVDPTDLKVVECKGLQADQRKRAFQMLFKEKSSFEITFKVGLHGRVNGLKERNLLFGGSTNLIKPCPPPPTTTTTTFEPRPEPNNTVNPEELSKCSWTPTGALKMIKDCTNRDMYEFKLGVFEKFVKPTYEPDVYGQDAHWRTFDTQRVGEGWTGSCVAYARTAGKTCGEWCETAQNMTCVRGMDDAHHQTKDLTQWLSTKGYTAKGRYGGCTIMPAGHERKTTEHNGCDQRWFTQICACVEK